MRQQVQSVPDDSSESIAAPIIFDKRMTLSDSIGIKTARRVISWATHEIDHRLRLLDNKTLEPKWLRTVDFVF